VAAENMLIVNVQVRNGACLVLSPLCSEEREKGGKLSFRELAGDETSLPKKKVITSE
jgi:hypothetical protein